MSDEINKANEPSAQAADSKELSVKELETVTGGDKATQNQLATENVTLNYSTIKWTNSQQKAD